MAVVADFRLWPERSLRAAVHKQKRSGAWLSAFVKVGKPKRYAEVIEPPQTEAGCSVVRRYGAKAGTGAGGRCVAMFVMPSRVPQVWSEVVDALATRDTQRLEALARQVPLQAQGHPILVETADDFLALTARMLAHAETFVAGLRQPAEGVWAKEGAVVERGCRLRGPVLLGANSYVARGANIAGPAVIGDEAMVGEDAFVGGSVVASGVRVPRGAQLWRSVIEEGAELAPRQAVSLSWADGGGCRRYRATESKVWFSSVVLPSRRALRQCHVCLYDAAKRAIDIAGALVGLALTLPLYPFIALAIKLETRGPVFFTHRRQTLGGREFGCLKFRSMVANALAMRAQLKNEVDGPQFFIENDRRLTRVGKFLRRTNLDEVPQFWNVLLGHMSLVGPRPSPDDENQFCPAWREARLSVRPGLTGMWQLRRTNRAGGDFHQWIQYDTQYVREASLLTDLGIIWETAVRMLRRI
ncbi:MAG TPA: sugar transferase [Planctomycetota bacterium]|nr:sugar transferase [Planctomycetota bacterium]HRR81543.1 sugar transferase [Planctomycetota bacterium]HRT97343.1 sugar transferase [Planctomycetota bacterium]